MNKLKDWRAWRMALLGAFIGGMANVGSQMLLESQTYNLETTAGAIAIVKGAIASGLISALLWMKQHPRPEADTATDPISPEKT